MSVKTRRYNSWASQVSATVYFFKPINKISYRL